MSEEASLDRFALVGSVVEGRFRIDRVVAEGGFGVVYQGTQLALDRPVAIKVLKTPESFNDEAKAQFLASFTAEARTIARINHPSIVQVYDFGLTDCPNGVRAPWMALEWLTGGTLEAELHPRRGRGGRTPAEVLGLLKPVLEAFALAHKNGIAHRDIKPANIMVVEGAAGASLRILDFGIAKIMESDELQASSGTGRTRTRSTQIAFSPAYAAPEQISQGRTGPWTDVHALALVISEMLTDEEPFSARDMTALYAQIMSPVRPTPKAKGRAIGAWEEVLQKALAVVPAERYRDAGELLRALEMSATAASSPEIEVPPPGAPTASGGHKTTHAAVAQDAPSLPVSKAPMLAVAAVGVLAIIGGIALVIGRASNNTSASVVTPTTPTAATTSAPSGASPAATLTPLADVPASEPRDIDAGVAAKGATQAPRVRTGQPSNATVRTPEPKVDAKPPASSRPKTTKDILE